MQDLAEVPDLKPLAMAALQMRIQMMSRWPMCQMPSAPLIRWWICRSRIGSKSACILRPATSTQMASGSAVPGLDVVDVRADHLDLAVLDLGQLARGHELEGRGLVAAEFDMRLLFADALALEGRRRRAPGSAPW